eukprot:8502722-Alexandrium_andersonii.AAC.1
MCIRDSNSHSADSRLASRASDPDPMPRRTLLLKRTLCVLIRRGGHCVGVNQGERLGDLMRLRQRTEALGIGLGGN